MTICPYCDYDNIEGVDTCEQCEQPLSDLHLAAPATLVEKSLLADHVELLQPNTPRTVAPNTSIRDVLNLMVEHGIGCVVVVEDDKVAGIFSERDALIKLNDRAAEFGDHPVSEFMTSPADSLEITAKIAFAVQRMDLGGYRHIPIVDENQQPTGIISVRDILRYLTDRMTSAETA